MKLLLFSLALLAVVFGDGETAPNADDEYLKELLAANNVTEEAVAEFFSLRINELPFTPASFKLYKDWIAKWNVDIKEIEIRSNEVMMRRVGEEVSRREKVIFERLQLRTALMTEFVLNGRKYLSPESSAKWDAMDAESTIFERKLVDYVSEQLLNEVSREWGIEAIEAAQEKGEPEDDGIVPVKDQEKKEEDTVVTEAPNADNDVDYDDNNEAEKEEEKKVDNKEEKVVEATEKPE